MTKKYISFILLLFTIVIGVMTMPLQSQAAVKINKKQITLQAGKSKQLKITGTKKKVKWSSSNRKVARVNSKGKVKGYKPGTTYIKAKVGKKVYKCKVKVTKKTTSTSTKPGSTTTNPSTTPGTSTTPGSSTTPTTMNKPSAATLGFDAGEYSISKTHKGEGTFYDRESTGAANLDYLEKKYYTVAMNNEDYMNGLAGAYIEITDKDGDKIKAFVTDRLPEGKKGDVDLTRKAFNKIEPLVTGRMNITWKIIPFPTSEPISYVFKPTSTQWWAQVQIRNSRYPIKKVEYLDKSTKKYVELPREEYNYFTASSGMGSGPITFRVTDFYGHVIVDKNISMNSTETPVKGKANFPY